MAREDQTEVCRFDAKLGGKLALGQAALVHIGPKALANAAVFVSHAQTIA